ncbi:Ribosome-binding factor A [Fimbriiglobus ruber]|uniref:Ribosome-binding factor A n=1 Tax=Fimbriiglobus ruber TaxID=1908690 RepID=A0A225DEX3_9BACT|nr:Ribosome-binding factor A [Fimbriiglobus ruber]
MSEVIREVAASTILFDLRDPRVKSVTVTRAEVSADLQHAKVHVSIMGTEREQLRTMQGLQNAAGFVQSKLAKRLTTRFIPRILFVLDEGVKKSIEIARLLREAQGESPESATAGETDAETEDFDDNEELTDGEHDHPAAAGVENVPEGHPSPAPPVAGPDHVPPTP